MNKPLLQPSNLEFLKLLKNNNNREWFAKNKLRFVQEQKQLIQFADELLVLMNKHDVIETPSGQKSLFRIYRDTRFAKDKTPYKTNWAGHFVRASKSRRGGYYFHIEPGNTFAAGGFWNPDPKDLKRIREELDYDDSSVRKILKSKSFVDTFGSLKGEQVKTTPKGFDSNSKAIDLIKYKQFLLIHKFEDKEIYEADFVKKVNDVFKKMRPFFDYMSDVLTSDANGIAL